MKKKSIYCPSWVRKGINAILLKMKLLTILIFGGTMALSASTYSQKTKIDLQFQNSSLIEILNSIESNTEYIFIYNRSVVNSEVKRNISVKGKQIEKVLDFLLEDLDIAYRIDDRQVFLYKKEEVKKPAHSERKNEVDQPIKKTISGKVTDTKGIAIPGVAVMVQGTTIGTVTDREGIFNLLVPFDAKVLIFSFVGLKTKEVTIETKLNFRVALEEETVGLEEVVAVGYGSQQKATITGAISSLGNDKLIQSPVSNISNALVGKMSGLLTTQGSGAPGFDESTLRIRGIGTFTGQTAPLIMVDGIEAQNYNNLDPNEIENISILKDASATAVYGVRGANGVLLITTKRGIAGKPQVSFSAQTAVSSIAKKRNYLGSPEWALGHNEATAYDSYVSGSYLPQYTAEDIQKYKDQTDPLFYPDVNWVDLVLKPTTSQSQYNFNISGGQEHVRYFISLGYLNQGGLFNGDVYDTGYDESIGYKRFNFRSNFDFDVTKRLKIKLNLSSQIENFKGNPEAAGNANNYGWAMSKLYVAPPNISPGVVDGKMVNLSTQQGQYYNSPLPEFFGLPFRRANNNFLNGTIRVDHDLDFIIKGLSVHTKISIQNRNSAIQTISKTLVQYLMFPIEGGKYGLGAQQDEGPFNFSETTNFNRRADFEAGFDYTRNFNKHTFTGLFLYNQSKEYPGPSLSIPRGYQGLVGRITYDFMKRYMAEFDIGYNGTENFAIGKRFGFFPAFSLGWVITEEPFFPKNKLLTYMKFRGSYGIVGNDQIGGTRFLYNPSSYVYGGGANYLFGIAGVNSVVYEGAQEGTLGNPNVTWEQSKKLDIGVDLVIAKELRATIDFFSEKRDNILASPGTVPYPVGATMPAFNFGKMENGGIDGEVSYNSKIKNLNYWIKAVFTFTDNKVIYRDEAQRPYSYLMSTGKRNGQYFGLLEDGFYNSWDEVIDAYRPVSSFSNNKIQPGDFKYKDINGDGIIDYDDNIPIGYSAFPGSSYGLSFGGDYKGFDFSILFQAAGRYSHLATKSFTTGWASGNGSTLRSIYYDAWTHEKYMAGEKITMPRISNSSSGAAHNLATNTRWVENSNYIRLKNFEVGYSLSKGILKKIGLTSVRMYVNGNNLLTISKLIDGEDPETPTWNAANNDPYPLMRTINGGVNVKF